MKLTRNQQRQMKKLAPHIDRITEADRVFFEQHPDRKHRLRFASDVEIAELEVVRGEVMTLPPGMRHFAIVPNVAPGVRLRVFVTNARYATTDVPEDVTAAIFDAVAPPDLHKVEASLRAALAEKAVRRERSAPFQAERGGRQRAPACAVSARICASLA